MYNVRGRSGSSILCASMCGHRNRVVTGSFDGTCLSTLVKRLAFMLPRRVTAREGFLGGVSLLSFPNTESQRGVGRRRLKRILPAVLQEKGITCLFGGCSHSLGVDSMLFYRRGSRGARPAVKTSVRG